MLQIHTPGSRCGLKLLATVTINRNRTDENEEEEKSFTGPKGDAASEGQGQPESCRRKRL